MLMEAHTHFLFHINRVCVCVGVPHPIVSFVNASLNSHQVAALVSFLVYKGLLVLLQLMVPTFCLQVLEPYSPVPGSLGKPAEGAVSPWHQLGEEPRPVSDDQLSERADGFHRPEFNKLRLDGGVFSEIWAGPLLTTMCYMIKCSCL